MGLIQRIEETTISLFFTQGKYKIHVSCSKEIDSVFFSIRDMNTNETIGAGYHPKLYNILSDIENFLNEKINN